MGLDVGVKKELRKNLIKYEGRVNHLYLDSRGYVTVGVGHLVKNRSAVASIVLCKTKNNVPAKIATLKEKQEEYDAVVKSVSRNYDSYKASYYDKKTRLVMTKEDIDDLLDKHILSFYKELCRIYTKKNGYFDEFDGFPQNAQLALFDMIFNLGAHKLVKQFKNFDKALKAKGWKKAAKESNRSDIGPDRNNYVKNLFLSIK